MKEIFEILCIFAKMVIFSFGVITLAKASLYLYYSG